MSEGFSIGVLASRTGLTPNLLRTWENRFGFPAGERTTSGHRRFSDDDVELVRRVLEARDAGAPLQMAIDSVLQRLEHMQATSVHAALVREFIHLRPERLGRSALVAASYAIEDEAMARADRPVVLGSFQHGYLFDESAHRWNELGRTALWSAVVADFGGRASDPADRPVRVHLPQDSPMRREWTVVVVSPGLSAVLNAWEIPSTGGSGTPRYEAIMSTGRGPAVTAARVIAGVARSAGVAPPVDVESMLSGAVPVLDTTGADADRVWGRVLAHLDAVG